MAVSLLDIAPGHRLGDYEIVKSLRAGGMATLLLGRRVGPAGFSRHVAIKLIHPHLAEDSGFVEMFLDEARLSAQIDHPNVVHVEALGEDGGFYYLVMEYVRGCSLSELRKELRRQGRPFDPALATHIAVQVAEGLHAAHETRDAQGRLLGVVHRDVSPQNILLSVGGYVKLIDFGIAKAEGRAHSTATGSIKGKFRYMSPEHASGNVLDRRADVYSLGIVLWEMLAGRQLIEGSDAIELLTAARTLSVDPPSAFRSDIPEALDAVVLAALDRDPERRIPSCQELRRRLIEAMPAAAAMDRSRLADFVHEVVGDRLEAESEEESLTNVSRVVATKDPERRAGQAPEGNLALDASTKHGPSRTRARATRPAAARSAKGRRVAWLLAALVAAILGASVAALLPPPAPEEVAAPVPSRGVAEATPAAPPVDDPSAPAAATNTVVELSSTVRAAEASDEDEAPDTTGQGEEEVVDQVTAPKRSRKSRRARSGTRRRAPKPTTARTPSDGPLLLPDDF